MTRVTWAIQVGCEDRWHTTSEPTADRAAAVEHLEWLRSLAAPSLSYRLARTTTTVATEIENA